MQTFMGNRIPKLLPHTKLESKTDLHHSNYVKTHSIYQHQVKLTR